MTAVEGRFEDRNPTLVATKPSEQLVKSRLTAFGRATEKRTFIHLNRIGDYAPNSGHPRPYGVISKADGFSVWRSMLEPA